MIGYAFVTFFSVLLVAMYFPSEWCPTFGNKHRLLSNAELSLYKGEQGSRGLFLALLGQIFDVKKGERHYGPGGAYHFMAGRDASLSFITGDFTDSKLTDDLSTASPLQLVSLYDWLSFYHKEYIHIGFVVGRYYTESGQPTQTLLQVEASVAVGRRLKAQAEADKARHPPCNSEWSPAGGRVWCSNQSGGVERDWAGFPRRLYSPGSRSERCVCVQNPADEDPNLKLYNKCPLHSSSCHVEPD